MLWLMLTKSLIGCIASYLTSCSDFAASMRTGECSGPRSLRGQPASLYTSYAVDVMSDPSQHFTQLMATVTFLPIRIVWSLQVRQWQRIAILALFASGIVCIAFATLRVIQIGRKAEDTETHNPIWLALWTVVEASIAICIGCCPGFPALFHTTRTPNASYNTFGYYRHTQSRSGDVRLRPDVISVNAVSVGAGQSRLSRIDPYWDDTRGSQEALAADNKSIVVTTMLHQDREQGNTHRTSASV